jgi:hypothetical protein
MTSGHASNRRTTARTQHHLRALPWLWRVCTVRSSALLSAQWSWLRHRLHGRTHGRGNSDRVRIISSATLDSITRWQECVEALNELRISSKELADSANHTRSIDSATLKVLHNVQKAVVDIRMIGKLNLDLIQIAQSVVQNWLLTRRLAHLLLCLLLLLLSGLCLRPRSKRHEHAWLARLCWWSLSLLCDWHRPTSKDVARPRRCSKREARLSLGATQWTTKQTMSRRHGYRLVEMHGWCALRLMLRSLLQPLTFLLLAVRSVLLFLDVDLLLALGGRRLTSRLTKTWQREIETLRSLGPVCGLSGRELAQPSQTRQAVVLLRISRMAVHGRQTSVTSGWRLL